MRVVSYTVVLTAPVPPGKAMELSVGTAALQSHGIYNYMNTLTYKRVHCTLFVPTFLFLSFTQTRTHHAPQGRQQRLVLSAEARQFPAVGDVGSEVKMPA